MASFELSPAYGRDYKSKNEVLEARNAGNDFIGGHQRGFKPIIKDDMPRPSNVILRYTKLTQIAGVQADMRNLFRVFEVSLIRHANVTSAEFRGLTEALRKPRF
jgi:hypothetical protein